MHRSSSSARAEDATARRGLQRRIKMIVVGLAFAGVMATVALIASPGRDASAATFLPTGLYTGPFTAAFPPPINPVHANCTFRIDTDTVPSPDVANMRAVCYTVAKTSKTDPQIYPPPAPPPPPPYTPLVPPVGLNILSGDINPSTGAITLQFSPSLCLPVDNLPNDGTPDGGIVASLTTSVNKAGVLETGSVVLQTDRTPPGGPFTCNDFVVDQTITGPFTPTPITDLNDDRDFDGCKTLAELSANAGAGGLRDPLNPFDYSDIDHNGTINIADILGIAGAFGGTMGALYVDYKDRGPTLFLNAWNLRPPDGTITIGDILAAASQFGNSCSHTHPAAGTAPPLLRYGAHPTRLSAAISNLTGAPFAISVDNAAGFPTSGQLLVNGETMTYTQSGGTCPGLTPATQFCVTVRGTAASHSMNSIVYHQTTSVGTAVLAATAARFNLDVGTTAGWAGSGYLRVDAEVMRYNQAAGCAGLVAATQFCIVERPCDNLTTDDDADGWVNDGCPQAGATSEDQGQCTGTANDDAGDDSLVNDGCPQLGAAPETVCTGTSDEDGDGRVNDGCPQAGTAPENPQCASNVDNDIGDSDGKVNDGCPVANTGPEGGSAHAIGARVLPQ